MATNKTLERTPRTVNISTVAALTDDLVVATDTPIMNAGTAVPPTVVTAPTTQAGVNLASDAGLSPTPAALSVPATPTISQIQARVMIGDMQAAWAKYYALCPADTGSFIEPTEDAIEARITTLMVTGVKMMAAAMTIKGEVDNERDAFNAGASAGNAIAREWLVNARSEVMGFVATLDTLIVGTGGKVKTVRAATLTSEPKIGRSSTKWTEWAPALNTYAKKIGLDAVYFVDQTIGGYKGTFHVLKLHTDGRWEKCDFNADSHVPTPTGQFVSSWKYFGTNGVDWTLDSAQNKIAHSLSKDEMYGILLIKNGKIVDMPQLSHALHTDKGVRVVGSVKHYAMPTVFWAAAGLTM